MKELYCIRVWIDKNTWQDVECVGFTIDVHTLVLTLFLDSNLTEITALYKDYQSFNCLYTDKK